MKECGVIGKLKGWMQASTQNDMTKEDGRVEKGKYKDIVKENRVKFSTLSSGV